jgi:hypothetical protein
VRGRLTAVAGALVALSTAAPATAAPIDVSLRIEGRAGTLYEGPLRTEARAVNGGDGTGSHQCGSGRPTVIGALADAAAAGGFTWRGTWNPDFQDFFVNRIGPDASDTATASFWSVLVDWRYSGGACSTDLDPSDQILWAYDTAYHPLLLSLTGPSRAAVGETIAVAVRDGWIRADSGTDGGPVAGAHVGGVTTDAAGRAVLSFDSPGLKRLKAERGDAIRSNALDVCVGDVRCAGALPPPVPPSARTKRALPPPRAVLRRAVRYLRQARAARQLSPSVRRRLRRALRLARPALAGPPVPRHGRARRLTAPELRHMRRCSHPSGAIGCGRKSRRRPVWSTGRAVIRLASTLAVRANERPESPAARRCGTATRCR